jgi:hypothetical protein
MAAFMLDSLVLRVISVLRDEIADTLRRGTSYAAGDKTPEIPFSMRHPSHGWQLALNKPAQQPDPVVDLDLVAAAAIGTGRSRRRSGALCRSTAMSAYRAVLSKTSRLPGREKLPAATSRCRIPTRLVALGGETLSGQRATERFTTTHETGLPGFVGVAKRTVTKVGVTSTARIPPVSTRGTGMR